MAIFTAPAMETITNGISPMGINIDMDKIASIATTLIVIYAVSMLLGYLQSLIMTLVGVVMFKDQLTRRQQLSVLCGIVSVVLMNLRFGFAI